MSTPFRPPYSVFISYPDEDTYFMNAIGAFLSFMDITCLIAEHQKDAGEELWDKFAGMIRDSTRVLLLYTNYASNSEWIKREISIARTCKKKFIPVKEENVELPRETRGEDREYIPFKRDDFIFTLGEVCRQVYEYRLRTPHVVWFTTKGRDTGKALVIIPYTNKAYWVDSYVRNLLTTGRLQKSIIDIHPWQPNTFRDWAGMQGLEIVERPPKPEELELL